MYGIKNQGIDKVLKLKKTLIIINIVNKFVENKMPKVLPLLTFIAYNSLSPSSLSDFVMSRVS